jgi:hypothetical protein
MTQEIKVEPTKEGIWTSSKTDPTVWWVKVGDYIRVPENFNTWTSKSIPAVGEPARLLMDGYYYWQEDMYHDGKPRIRRQKKEDYEEKQERQQQNEERKIQDAAVRPTFKPWQAKKWDNNQDWYKIVDMKVVTSADIPALLQSGYTLLNKTDITKTSFWNSQIGQQQFVFVKREKISND